MAENQQSNTQDVPADRDPNARHTTSEADKAKARKWFARARQLVDTRSHDYAIKCFIDGLALWPEAVDDGHQALRACALARRHAGGKKMGLRASVMSGSGKGRGDPVHAMLKAEERWAHDPSHVSHIEDVFKNAGKARCDDTLMWVGAIYREALENEKKPNPKKFALLKEVYEDLGDRAEARGELDLAAEAYERGIEALSVQRQLSPRDLELANVLRDLSTKLTILKGKYDRADSFKESVLDAGQQRDTQDQDRMVQSDERLTQLIAAAEAAVKANPGVPGKVMALVELLCRRDNEEDEKRAISILVKQYQDTDDYRFKQRADDIRVRQLAREARRARDSGDREAIRSAMIKQLQFEIPTYKERAARYPTDMRIRYEYGLRLFNARKYDEAIPCFQTARGDMKHRVQCSLYLGRCFYEKKFFSEAVATLEEGRAGHEATDDAVAKELLYWLGRAQADSGETTTAAKTYGHLLQLDYNYRDVRSRIEHLRAG
jgi:tetratricopeptide (TPR) repeat protein